MVEEVGWTDVGCDAPSVELVLKRGGAIDGEEMEVGAIRSGGEVMEVDIAVTGVAGWAGGTMVGNVGVERVVGVGSKCSVGVDWVTDGRGVKVMMTARTA